MDEIIKEKARVLIVDDQEYNVRLLERILKRNGFQQYESTMNPLDVMRLFSEFQPDIILLDLHMPEMNGFEVMQQLKEVISPQDYLPILVLTADVTPEAKQKALSEGAKDFLTKPFDKTEVTLRIRNLLETRFLHLQLQNQNEVLEEKVRERTRELQQAQEEILKLSARSAEFRDDDTGQHTQRVGQLVEEIARHMGLSVDEVNIMKKASTLHDVGKLGIPDHILLKPGRFTDEEFEQMKQHTRVGAEILSGSQFPVLQMAEVIALTHHERWDGTGYPRGLKGEEIPLAGRIVALADFFDALTHERPYKKAWSVEETIDEILRQKGKHFDPRVVDAFLEVVRNKV